jgi:hypothetical protein
MVKKKNGQVCLKNIFIVSSISYVRSFRPAIHFFQQQKYLESIGFTVVNAIEMQHKKKKISYTYDSSTNLKKLIDCKWVCIMSDISLKDSSNTELLISSKLNMIIIHSNVLEIDVEIIEEEENIGFKIKDEFIHN